MDANRMPLPDRLDTTIAHKAINLCTDLSSAEKGVAGAIIDHFNRRTGQCDPGVDRLASLLGLNRRTVLRAVDRLHEIGLITKIRHGGHSNRNDYEPVWVRFREMDAAWSARFNGGRARSRSTDLSSTPRHDCHLSSVESVTQTSSTNQSKEPSPARPGMHTGTKTLPMLSRSGLAEKETGSRRRTPSSSAVGPVEAERRWTAAVHREFCSSPEAYGVVIDAIGTELGAAATQAEMRNRGSGLRVILDHLGGGGAIRTRPALEPGPASAVRSQQAGNE